MEEKDTKVYSRELFFDDSGEALKVSVEFRNVSPEKINIAKPYVKTLWEKLMESVFIF